MTLKRKKDILVILSCLLAIANAICLNWNIENRNILLSIMNTVAIILMFVIINKQK